MRSFFRYKMCALALTMVCIGAVVYPQRVITIVEVDEVPDPEEKAPPATPQRAAQAAIEVSPQQFRQTLTFKPNLPFDEARAMFATHTTTVPHKGIAGTKLASLPPVVVSAPQPPVEKARVAWTATLPERQEIARSYLEKNCKAILTLEKMQSAASKKETDGRFMKAKSPGHIIATLKAQLRGYPITVSQFCPTEFYNQLFASK